ncbi:MAG TPA: hypothetical protein VN643_15195 [Pyrinomonadaceae bacterium]|nr:hypothetical protein [Pyrinomonadaceae bacterium]
MRISRFIVLAAVVTAAFVLLSQGEVVSAQCAMCRSALTGANNATFIRNLNIGVLVLLVPPVTIFCSIFVILKRRASGDEK